MAVQASKRNRERAASGPARAGQPHARPLAEGEPLPPAHDRPASASAALADLYRSQRPALLRFIARHFNPERAPDLVQQVFAKFLSLPTEKRAVIASPAPYLKRSARNVMIDQRKAAQRHGDAQHISDEEVALHAPCQIAALEARDMLNRIEVALQKLKPITRDIFLAHRLDGYSYAEIAERTGLSVKTVEKHMSRAIAHIDRILAPR